MSPLLAPGGTWLLAGVAVALYLLTALPSVRFHRLAPVALLGALVLHALLLVVDIGGLGQPKPGARLGFGPVSSMTVWLVIAVYMYESRLLPLPTARQWLGLAGTAAVLVEAIFPGELHQMHSALAPLHFALGVGSYGLFGAAVLHALLLDAAERRLRSGLRSGPGEALQPGVTSATRHGEAHGENAQPRAAGMPLLQLERLTFKFVQAGFVVLSATLILGILSTVQWRWTDHKTVFSVLAWAVFAALLLGRRLRGWRGYRATRWLYAGALLLLLAYVGSRFVLEVLLTRPLS
jgi:ABC-type uncharacterized transport system permease subunit